MDILCNRCGKEYVDADETICIDCALDIEEKERQKQLQEEEEILADNDKFNWVKNNE